MAKGKTQVSIDSIVRNLGKDIKFVQPLQEGIVNSLEANATKIEVGFLYDEQFEGVEPIITGYYVVDNGDGFTKENRESFKELWTTHKRAEYGCKGSGRYMWLAVFNNIEIESNISSENVRVTIPFSKDFDQEIDIQVSNLDIDVLENNTLVVFKDVNKKYNISLSNFSIDKVAEEIQNTLLIKLFLIKNSGKSFEIIIKMGEESKIISSETIPDLLESDFSIENEYDYSENSKIDFKIYYHFYNVGNSKQAYYCANNRIVKNIENDSLGLHAPFPEPMSLNMLLTSKYFDEMCNEARDDFPALSGNRTRNATNPILLTDINAKLKKEMLEIILEKFPKVVEHNKKEEENAIAEKPHLAQYIKENNDIVKDVKSLITDAEKKFQKDKKDVKKKFDEKFKLLNIDSDGFLQSVAEVSEVAQKELGEYIVYRNHIIKALEEGLGIVDEKEKFFHDIFMIQKTMSNNVDNEYLTTNLWLLDDKYMTFTQVFSDVKMKAIIEVIENEYEKRSFIGERKRPDLSIFYNSAECKDLVVVEFKKPYATLIEKESASTEIIRNIGIIKENATNINSIFGYIILDIDEELERSLVSDDFLPLYTNSQEGKILYKYNKHNNAHIYVIDYDVIVKDAFARNKCFMDILKK